MRPITINHMLSTLPGSTIFREGISLPEVLLIEPAGRLPYPSQPFRLIILPYRLFLTEMNSGFPTITGWTLDWLQKEIISARNSGMAPGPSPSTMCTDGKIHTPSFSKRPDREFCALIAQQSLVLHCPPSLIASRFRQDARAFIIFNFADSVVQCMRRSNQY